MRPRSGSASWSAPQGAGGTGCRCRCCWACCRCTPARHAEFLHHEVPGITIPDEVRAAMRAAGERGTEVGLEAALRAAARDASAGRRAPTSCPASGATSSRPSWCGGSAPNWPAPARTSRRHHDASHAPPPHRVRHHAPRGAWPGCLAALATLLLTLAPLVAAQAEEAPFPPAARASTSWTQAKVINGVDEAQLQADLQALLEDSGMDIAIYTRSRSGRSTP